jgi:glycosyltransferase involved in cell wall biosynthesis
VIHNWVPISHVRPIPRHQNALRVEWALSDRFVVGYSGNMGRAHEFDTILAAAEVLQNDPTVTFLLIGGGAHRERVEREIESRGLRNVLLKPYQPVERLAHSLSAPDMHVVTLRPEMEGCIVPSKFYGVLAAGRPLVFIGRPDGEIGRLVTAHACGFAVWPGDHAGLVTAIDQLRRSPHRLSDLSENAVRAAVHFDRQRALEKWRTILFAAASAGDERESISGVP